MATVRQRSNNATEPRSAWLSLRLFGTNLPLRRETMRGLIVMLWLLPAWSVAVSSLRLSSGVFIAFIPTLALAHPSLTTRSVILALLPTLSLAQTGTTTRNISSSSSALSFVGNWRSESINIVGQSTGVYEAYSNESSASCTIAFLGVGLAYVAVRASTRGLTALKLDDVTPSTVDLYSNSPYPQVEQVIWQSPVLPYGNHTVELYQQGIDPRFGCVMFTNRHDTKTDRNDKLTEPIPTSSQRPGSSPTPLTYPPTQ